MKNTEFAQILKEKMGLQNFDHAPAASPAQSSTSGTSVEFVKEFGGFAKVLPFAPRSYYSYAMPLQTAEAAPTPVLEPLYCKAKFSIAARLACMEFKLLGASLGEQFSASQLKHEWRRLLHRFHPDHGLEANAEKFLRLQDAYNSLRCELADKAA